MDQTPFPTPPQTPAPVKTVSSPTLPAGTPSPQAQQWGAVISIIIIVLMVIIGAFYAWGERIAKQQGFENLAPVEETQ